MQDNLNELEKYSVHSSDVIYTVFAEAVKIGNDYLVYLWGGEAPHIGAVAAAQPRPSLVDPAETSASSSVLTYLGHKEDIVAKQVAEDLSSALDENVVVTAGIHWDNIEKTGIEKVVTGCREVTEALIEVLGKRNEETK
ncbi:MAG: hypothetical protein HN731_17255 [Rhodospirillaceae bacterium]|jgi:gallate decarboxylase subunit D|nr:hypothetical protein [Rhodospirillaceae bacterium]